ncbi:unnamed protein product [Kluyveromyces dobzhanskii CBS 2104]|uniref:WGS project CCBQ000000000 data, contig 00105 n=1 Tax=Kluyveromyces dobzhanskii CBS 2104 TaxID=1427455 RepID=A0A0A8L1R5_9SACH|nr:unnamed protein product [Kluyveromyces dobzhanskii CBS 2104]
MAIKLTGDNDIGPSNSGVLLLRESGSLGIGEVNRWKVVINKDELLAGDVELTEDTLYLEVRNLESALVRPVWLTGPYSIYVDVVPVNYDERKEFTGDKIDFVSDLKPDETFETKLYFNSNSQINGSSYYGWNIDLIAQFTVVTIAKLPFVLTLATTPNVAKHAQKDKSIQVEQTGAFKFSKLDTEQIWNLPPVFPEKPVHLVIITHGIFSSIGGDMLCLKDTIERAANSLPDDENDNLVIRGFPGNVGKSYKGIKNLGFKLADYIIDTVDKLKRQYHLSKISFVGHSLGGPVQAMAIHYISVERPDIFDKEIGLTPVNFVAAASPFLGVIGDFPKYVSALLDIGALGQTGRDLTLKRNFFLPSKGIVNSKEHHERIKAKPILEILPKDPALEIFQRFKHRTVYANVAFDGIVPLRTAALLYLDWKGLSDVHTARNESDDTQSNQDKDEQGGPKTGEIPESSIDKRSFLQWMLPQALIKKEKYKSYVRTQTNSSIESASSEANNNSDSSADFRPPRKANTLISAVSTISAPLPEYSYLVDPSSRSDRIIHDKMYTPEELPEIHYKHKKLAKKIIYPNYSVHVKEERIARLWQETMDWRKVVVELHPDSHNNIIVRRRFVNSFGWIVVNHIADEHFGSKSLTK